MKKLFIPAFAIALLAIVTTGCFLNDDEATGGGECPGRASISVSYGGDTYNLAVAEGSGSAVTADGTITFTAAPRNGQFPRLTVVVNYSQAGTYDLGSTKPDNEMEIQGQITLITGLDLEDTYTTGITLPESGNVTLDAVDFRCGGEVSGSFECTGTNTDQDELEFDGTFTFVLNNFVEAN